MSNDLNVMVGNGPDPIDERLRAAGMRLRDTAPDSVTTHQALRQVHETAAARPVKPDRTRWVPYAWAGGLAAAAVIGVVALVARSQQETIREIPADTTPVTVPVAPVPTDPPAPTTVDESTTGSTTPSSDPVVVPSPTDASSSDALSVVHEFRDDHCFAISLDAPDRRIGRAAGCIPLDALGSDRLYLTLMEDELYRITATEDVLDAAGRPLLTISSFPEWSSASCGLIDAFPPEPEPGADASPLVIELVACSGGDRPVALGARIPQEQGASPAAFTTASQWLPEGTELSGPVPVAGLRGVNAYYAEPLDNVRCVAITQLPPGSSPWREQCWTTTESAGSSAIAAINGAIVQLDVADESAPTASTLDGRGLPYSGCGLADLDTMVNTVYAEKSPAPMFTAVRCDDTSGVLQDPFTRLQNGTADGGYEEFQRAARIDEWSYLGGGTFYEAAGPYDVLPFDLWSAWPGDTTANVVDPSEVGLQGGSTDPSANAQAIVELLERGVDPEFPTNPTLLATWPAEGVPTLVVVRQDVGGDDSVVGAVHYVHLTGGPDDYRVADWYVSAICGRGGGPDLCI
ncbi:MAG: hypothetical protein HKN44_13730 [Ilumatobacter sp.]|nr:hypothetical protein [Ilumatobacter sp.]